MKLNINAKELLALHNLLYERFACAHVHHETEHDYKEGDGPTADEVQLRQVYNRLKACIVGSLTGKAIDPFDAWQAREQAKIDRLTEDLEDVKKEQADLSRPLVPEDFQAGQDDDFALPEYPRRGVRQGQGRSGSRGGHKR